MGIEKMTNEMNTSKPSFEELLSKPIHINKNKDEDKKDKHNKEEKKVIYKEYFNYVEALYDEWCNRIVNYPTFKNMLKCFGSINPDLPPQFFTGDIESDVVMISLNGHAGDKKKDSEIDATIFCKTFVEYFDFWEEFAKNRYSPNGKANIINQVSYFDQKLHCFISGNTEKAKSEDLAEWNFFHMELCPFLSSSYHSIKKPAQEIMKKFLFRVLDAIALYPRKRILVLNRQVCKILDKLPMKDNNDNYPEQSKDVKELWIQKQRLESKPITFNNYKIKAFRIDYKIQHIILDGEAFKENDSPLDIIAVPTFAKQSMAGKILIEYGQKAFDEQKHKHDLEYLKEAIGVL